jgi:hypothetical protein
MPSQNKGEKMSKGISLKQNTETNNAPLIVIRKLVKEGATGELARGTYEGKKENKFGQMEYHVRGADGTLFIFPNCSAISEQLGDAIPGLKVRAEYNGAKKTKAGRTFHDYEFFVLD